MRKVTIYVHEESNTIVSRLCNGCKEIKLVDEFGKFKIKTSYSSLCIECLEEEAGTN